MEKFIGTKEFVFRKRIYQYDGEKVCYRKHKETEEYMRVGDIWYRIDIPNKKGGMERHIKKWKIEEIKRDYKKYPEFIDDIPKYKEFCNVPDNTTNYKSEHRGCYNIYAPLKHELKEGNIESTLKFLKHIFRGNADAESHIAGDPFTVALDYLTIMYQYPEQILPVLCLVSPENNTGKTTFLKWLKDVYESNATILGNEHFKMPFNSHYITKYIIGIDEGFIEVEKKADKERLKKLATDEQQFLQFKGVDLKEIDFYGKIIICSNEADNLMKIDEGEIRWFIIRVPQFEKEDIGLRKKMKEEIPAWLYFLKTRDIFHANEGRAWFDPKYLETEQLKKIIANTKSRTEKEIESFIKDMFLTYRIDTVRIHLDYLTEAVSKLAKYKIDKIEVKKYLKEKRKLSPETTQKIKIPYNFMQGLDGKNVINYNSFTQRPYIFKAEDWLTEEEEMSEFNSKVDFDYEEQEIPF